METQAVTNFKIGGTVARKCDTWRKGTITAIMPRCGKVKVKWKRRSATVPANKLTLIEGVKIVTLIDNSTAA